MVEKRRKESALSLVEKQPAMPATQTSSSTPDFSYRWRIEGSASLYVTSEGIGSIRKKINVETGMEEETWLPYWSKRYIPIVHRVFVVRDTHEGMETRYDLEIDGVRHIVPIEDFKSGRWVAKFHTAVGALSPAGHGKYVDAIATVAMHAARVIGQTTTGFLDTGTDETPDYVFLLPDGRHIDAQGTIHSRENNRVTLIADVLSPQALELWDGFEIPTICTAEQQRDYLNFLRGIGEHGQGLLLAAHGARTFAYDIRAPAHSVGHTLILLASRGKGKTSLAAMARGIWPYRERPLADASFADTISSMETIAGFRSFPVIIDDLTPNMTATPALSTDTGKIVDRIARGVHDEKATRQRMTQHMRKQKANIIRTMPIMTWECVPDAPDSLWRRVVFLGIEDDEIAITPAPGKSSLSEIKQHWPAQNYTFFRLVVSLLDEINTHGMDKVASKFARLAGAYEEQLRQNVYLAWEEKHRGQQLPADWHNLAKLYSQELLGIMLLGRALDENILHECYPHILYWLIKHIERLAGLTIDEEGYSSIDYAILSILEKIGSKRTIDGHYWRIERYHHSSEIYFPLCIAGDHQLPDEQWGGPLESDDRRAIVTVGYMNDTVLYIGQEFRQALRKELGLSTDKALSQLLDKAGWIKRQEAGRCSIHIRPHGRSVPRVLALRNSRLWSLLGITGMKASEEKLEERPDMDADFEEVAYG